MKSVKPGRGPSFMGGIGGIAAGVFGIIWTISASSMGAPGIFTAFGVVFILLAVGSAIYNLLNAAGKKRFSAFDITDGDEEPDPLNERFGRNGQTTPRADADGDGFCPYCGAKTQDAYRYCEQCGKELPMRQEENETR